MQDKSAQNGKISSKRRFARSDGHLHTLWTNHTLWKSSAHFSERIDTVGEPIYRLGEPSDALWKSIYTLEWPADTLWEGADRLGEPICGPQGRLYTLGERADTLWKSIVVL
jgi:hypothetical protein